MRRVILTGWGLAGCLLLNACVGSGEAVARPTNGALIDGTPVQIVKISVRDNSFSPGRFRVAAGRPIELTIENVGRTTHEVFLAAPDRCCVVDPTAIPPGAAKTWSRFALKANSTYRLACRIHAEMSGEFTVE